MSKNVYKNAVIYFKYICMLKKGCINSFDVIMMHTSSLLPKAVCRSCKTFMYTIKKSQSNAEEIYTRLQDALQLNLLRKQKLNEISGVFMTCIH